MLGILHDWIFRLRGGEKVLKTILSLFRESKLFCFYFKKGVEKVFDDHFGSASFLNQLPYNEKYYRLLLPLIPLAVKHLKSQINQCDSIISISHCAAKNVYSENLSNLCYCLSPFRAVYDLEELYARGDPVKKFVLRIFKRYDQAFDKAKVQFIAISEFVRERIERAYEVKVLGTIYPPCEVEKIKVRDKSYTESQVYITGGALVENKNFDLVIKAFNKLKLKLYIFGDGPLKKHLISMSEPNIVFLGHLSDQELMDLFVSSKAFVFPSVEDFGITSVEYLASGGPVIGLNFGGTKEICSTPELQEFLIPYTSSKEDLVDQIVEKVLEVEKLKLPKIDPKEIRQHSQKFSTSRFVNEFKALLYSINHSSIKYLKVP
ncbi:MAG: glycosyltransferase [Deltaproteobacteria bacterium]|nr:glycosyltransferase [Deltaproteobacteria bacterium]